MNADVLSEPLPVQSFLALVFFFGFLPGFVLRLVTLLYPRDDPQRRELIGELYTRPRWERPWFVAEQLETALSEGLPRRAAVLYRAVVLRIRTLRTSDASVEGYSGNRAADIVGITYQQLDYWVRADVITPLVTDTRGRWSRQRYSYRNLLELKLVKTLLDNGHKLQSIGEAFMYLRDQLGGELGRDVTPADLLVIAGDSGDPAREAAEFMDMVHRYQSEGVITLLALDGVKEQVDAAIVSLFPANGDGAL